MNEAKPKAELVKTARALLRNFVIFRHEDTSISGIPDISMSGRKLTSWWEVKLADPTFDTKEIQEVRMRQLNVAGYARYIIFIFDPVTEKKTGVRIVAPIEFPLWKTSGEYLPGWDYAKLVERMYRPHAG